MELPRSVPPDNYSHLTQKVLKFLQEVIIQLFSTVGRAARAIGDSVPEKARAARPTFRVTVGVAGFRRFLDQMGVAAAS
ncbi:MAG: hypothetical protein Q7U57_15560 [Methylovulum sp.]|nr:hypothetical protein [Methylovulum sp.]